MTQAMNIASFCAMTCAEGGFHVFLTEKFGDEFGKIQDTDIATRVVRHHCGILSRRELNEDGPAKSAWLELQSEYKGWLMT